MQANISLILNVFLLVGVVVAIAHLMKVRRKIAMPSNQKPSLGSAEHKPFDDIIAVRKINYDLQGGDNNPDNIVVKPTISAPQIQEAAVKTKLSEAAGRSAMMFLLAKENRQLAGYELLQTVLASGLRFGEGNLFHRHQHPNGQGPVLCSLAAATPSGVFDLQNIGAFRVRGLCLFMQASGNPTIDAERFAIMYETARQLSDGLDTYLLDDCKKPLNEASLQYYQELLHLHSETSLA